jgi:hypothetical protein
MDSMTQSIIIVVAIIILVGAGGWLFFSQRRKGIGNAAWKAGNRQSTPRQRREARRQTKNGRNGGAGTPTILPQWEENRPSQPPAEDRSVSSPELKDSMQQTDEVVALTPPGKNGRGEKIGK